MLLKVPTGTAVEDTVNVPTVLPHVGKVAERHPKLRIIIDHMGRTRGMRDETLAPGLKGTIALAKHPNVHVKLTLAPECWSAPWPYRNIHGALHNLIEAFTPRRCFWGTDITSGIDRFPKFTYQQRITHFTEELPFLSEEDKDWIMGRAIMRRLGWA